MKLYDIYNRLDETLDSSLPYKKIRDTRYEINIGLNKIYLMLNFNTVDNFKCVSIMFISDNNTAITNYFNGPKAVRVFSTILDILRKITFDLILFTPDDIIVEIENKKTRLYMIILRKLEKMGFLVPWSSQKITFDNFDKPVLVSIRTGSKAFNLSDEKIAIIIKQVGYQKV